MAALFDLWCGLLPRTRLFCWLGWSLGLGLLACLCAFSSGAGATAGGYRPAVAKPAADRRINGYVSFSVGQQARAFFPSGFSALSGTPSSLAAFRAGRRAGAGIHLGGGSATV